MRYVIVNEFLIGYVDLDRPNFVNILRFSEMKRIEAQQPQLSPYQNLYIVGSKDTVRQATADDYREYLYTSDETMGKLVEEGSLLSVMKE